MQVPVLHDNHTAFVNDADSAGIAVTQDPHYYALLSLGELHLYDHKPIQFCQLFFPLYQMEETPNCTALLFKKSLDLAEVHCLQKSVPLSGLLQSICLTINGWYTPPTSGN